MLIRAAAGSAPGSSAEEALTKALEGGSGVLLRNFLVTSGRSVREVDTILLMPSGIATVEVKGTRRSGEVTPSLNGPWKIGGAEADFSGGPNPIPQARKSAQLTRAMLGASHLEVGFVLPVVCVVGKGVQVRTWTVGDTLTCAPDGLLAGLEDAFDGRGLSAEDALAVLRCLDVTDISLEDLKGQGFTPAGKVSEKVGAKERRVMRRRSELAHKADELWKTSNRRRVWVSAVGTVAAVAFTVFTGSWFAAGMGLLTVFLFALFDLYRRSNLEGPRTSGGKAVLGWLLTLGPIGGVGAAAGVFLSSTFVYDFQAALALQLSLLVSLALLACTFAGRSSFVYPPPMVVEKHDPEGHPLGVFYLVDAKPQGKQLDWPRSSAEGSRYDFHD